MQYTQEQLNEILEKHRRWLLREDGAERAIIRGADLRGASLRGANLRCARLCNADLGGADLGGADLSGAVLTFANFRDANLGGASLIDADLRFANLSGSCLSGAALIFADLTDASLVEIEDMEGASGNCHEVKSIQAGRWPVTYTATQMQIGCQMHRIEDWWAFTDDEIEPMDSEALLWWGAWKPILKQIIEISPAVPGSDNKDGE